MPEPKAQTSTVATIILVMPAASRFMAIITVVPFLFRLLPLLRIRATSILCTATDRRGSSNTMLKKQNRYARYIRDSPAALPYSESLAWRIGRLVHGSQVVSSFGQPATGDDGLGACTAATPTGLLCQLILRAFPTLESLRPESSQIPPAATTL